MTLKVLELLSRRTDTTHDQAMRYWTERHAALVKESARDDAKTRRYVNNVGLDIGFDGWQPFATCPYDGIVAVWVDRSFESLRKIILWPENSFVPDEPNFVRCRPYLMPVEELVHRDTGGARRSKLMVLFTRPLGSTYDDAIRQWRECHVPLELDFWGDRLVRLTTNAAIPFVWSDWGNEMAAYDGCAEYWFDLSPEAVMEALQDGPRALLNSRRTCMGTTAQMFIDEVVQIDRDAV